MGGVDAMVSRIDLFPMLAKLAMDVHGHLFENAGEDVSMFEKLERDLLLATADRWFCSRGMASIALKIRKHARIF